MALLMLRSSGFHGSPYAKEFGSMALLMLRSSGFRGSPYAKELSTDGALPQKEE